MFAAASALPAPDLTLRPQSVFAAVRKSFEVVAHPTMGSEAVKRDLFETLPLTDNGWEWAETNLRRIGNCWCGTTWIVTRN